MTEKVDWQFDQFTLRHWLYLHRTKPEVFPAPPYALAPWPVENPNDDPAIAEQLREWALYDGTNADDSLLMLMRTLAAPEQGIFGQIRYPSHAFDVSFDYAGIEGLEGVPSNASVCPTVPLMICRGNGMFISAVSTPEKLGIGTSPDVPDDQAPSAYARLFSEMLKPGKEWAPLQGWENPFSVPEAALDQLVKLQGKAVDNAEAVGIAEKTAKKIDVLNQGNVAVIVTLAPLEVLEDTSAKAASWYGLEVQEVPGRGKKPVKNKGTIITYPEEKYGTPTATYRSADHDGLVAAFTALLKAKK